METNDYWQGMLGAIFYLGPPSVLLRGREDKGGYFCIHQVRDGKERETTKLHFEELVV